MVGKPVRAFFESALESIDESLKPEQAVMIGDDARDDALGAINAGMRAILVRTGKYREGLVPCKNISSCNLFLLLINCTGAWIMVIFAPRNIHSF